MYETRTKARPPRWQRECRVGEYFGILRRLADVAAAQVEMERRYPECPTCGGVGLVDAMLALAGRRAQALCPDCHPLAAAMRVARCAACYGTGVEREGGLPCRACRGERAAA